MAPTRNHERVNMTSQRQHDGYARTALRLPHDLHKAVHAAAQAEDRSFNGQIVAVLRAALLPNQTPNAAQ